MLNRRTKLCCDNDLACRCSACEKRARVLGRHSGLELVLKALGSPYLRPREPSSREPERKKSRQEGLRSASLFSSSAAPAKPTLGRHNRQLHTRMNSSRLPFVEKTVAALVVALALRPAPTTTTAAPPPTTAVAPALLLAVPAPPTAQTPADLSRVDRTAAPLLARASLQPNACLPQPRRAVRLSRKNPRDSRQKLFSRSAQRRRPVDR